MCRNEQLRKLVITSYSSFTVSFCQRRLHDSSAGSQFPSLWLNKGPNVTVRLSLFVEYEDLDKILELFRTETQRLTILHKHPNVIHSHRDNMVLCYCLIWRRVAAITLVFDLRLLSSTRGIPYYIMEHVTSTMNLMQSFHVHWSTTTCSGIKRDTFLFSIRILHGVHSYVYIPHNHTAYISFFVRYLQNLCRIRYRKAYKQTNKTIPNAALPHTFQ